MARAVFSGDRIPAFDDAPSAILITSDLEFFLDESAAAAVQKLVSADTELLDFDDESSAETISDALLNRSLFSPRRVVRFDISRLLGSTKPGELLDAALEAWAKGTPGGKRDAFRKTRALLSALGLPPSDNPEEIAAAAARKVRRKDDPTVLAEILRELPQEAGGPAVLRDALRYMIPRANDGTVALLTALSPPEDAALFNEIAERGLVLSLDFSDRPKEMRAEVEQMLRRLAQKQAKEREVAVEPAAIARLIARTDAAPQAFASELSKLLDWAGPGGQIRAADVQENVEDEASEDLYELYDAIGKRDAADVLGRVERAFSGRVVHAGDRIVDTDHNWPVIFLGMLTTEIRRMLLVRSFLDGPDAPAFDSSMPYRAFQTRILPRLAAPVAPYGRSPFANASGQVSPFLWFKTAQRALPYSTRELARSLARAAETDAALKSSASPLEAITSYVARLIAGD